MVRLKLSIEPIPISTWGKSLANRLPKKEWDDMRTQAYREADYKCQVCGDINGTLNAHEQWAFNEKLGIQKLVGIEVCCETCHNVHHFGRSKAVFPKHYIEKLITHWCTVNGLTRNDFIVHERGMHAISRKRADKYYIVKVGRRTIV